MVKKMERTKEKDGKIPFRQRLTGNKCCHFLPECIRPIRSPKRKDTRGRRVFQRTRKSLTRSRNNNEKNVCRGRNLFFLGRLRVQGFGHETYTDWEGMTEYEATFRNVEAEKGIPIFPSSTPARTSMQGMRSIGWYTTFPFTVTSCCYRTFIR